MNGMLTSLRNNNFSIIGTSPIASICLENSVVRAPLAIVLGNEAEGITENLKSSLNTVIRINKYGDAESLNVAVAAGIVMQHYSNFIDLV
jgi:tRNA G18 (ribose-2'-O)-methylase SpoU